MKRCFFLYFLLMQSLWAASLDAIRERDYLIVGVRDRLKGIGYANNGQYEGLEIEIARQLAQSILGDAQKVKFVPVNGSGRITALKTDEVDLVLAYFVANAQRKKAVDFGEPYLQAAMGAINHDGQDIRASNYFQDKKVLVLESGSADIFFRHYMPDVQAIKCNNYEECFKRFAQKEGDVFVNDLTVLYLMSQIYRNSDAGIQNLSHFYHHENVSPSVDKGNKALLELVNAEIKAMKSDGRLEEIFKRTMLPHMKDVQSKELLAP